ncbi:MAG: TerB family tellurite resistance protein [Labilithrix sp.]|nr:TerB family tellurite resistance protein [Labilithrix sp.]MCW5813609.1 TerB family tellurite resistance protein [Labilithrix sp.]
MHDGEYAIVRALVPVAWADGEFAQKEREMLDGLLEAYGATESEREQLREYAKEKRTLDDIDLQELSAGDRRVLLQIAVLLSFADGHQHADEIKIVNDLATKLRIPADEAKAVIAAAEERAKKNLSMLV